jgi:hypothetical protein
MALKWSSAAKFCLDASLVELLARLGISLKGPGIRKYQKLSKNIKIYQKNISKNIFIKIIFFIISGNFKL